MSGARFKTHGKAGNPGGEMTHRVKRVRDFSSITISVQFIFFIVPISSLTRPFRIQTGLVESVNVFILKLYSMDVSVNACVLLASS